mmetsp:Transcript_5995/g.17433  ORF Transcript_5995/g.17433 Transcript_5995/m.17433 type:complete len:434 (-) Transcript_5995:158-1459(-)
MITSLHPVLPLFNVTQASPLRQGEDQGRQVELNQHTQRTSRFGPRSREHTLQLLPHTFPANGSTPFPLKFPPHLLVLHHRRSNTVRQVGIEPDREPNGAQRSQGIVTESLRRVKWGGDDPPPRLPPPQQVVSPPPGPILHPTRSDVVEERVRGEIAQEGILSRRAEIPARPLGRAEVDKVELPVEHLHRRRLESLELIGVGGNDADAVPLLGGRDGPVPLQFQEVLLHDRREPDAGHVVQRHVHVGRFHPEDLVADPPSRDADFDPLARRLAVGGALVPFVLLPEFQIGLRFVHAEIAPLVGFGRRSHHVEEPLLGRGKFDGNVADDRIVRRGSPAGISSLGRHGGSAGREVGMQREYAREGSPGRWRVLSTPSLAGFPLKERYGGTGERTRSTSGGRRPSETTTMSEQRNSTGREEAHADISRARPYRRRRE